MKGKLKGKRHRWSAWLLLLFSNILDKIIKICINLVLTARINLHQAMNFGNSDMIINWQYVVIEKILRKKGNNTCTYLCIYQKCWGIKQLCIITLLQFRICLHIFTMDSTVKCRGGQKRENVGKSLYKGSYDTFQMWRHWVSKMKYFWSQIQSFVQQLKCLKGLKQL